MAETKLEVCARWRQLHAVMEMLDDRGQLMYALWA